MTRALRVALVSGALVATLSACEATVRLSADVRGDGAGVLALQASVDDELLAQMQVPAPSGGGGPILEIESYFDELRARGWTVSRTTPRGGLSLRAAKPFDSPSALSAAAAELRGTRGIGIDATLRYESSPSLLRSRARLSGTVDTSRALNERARAMLDGLLDELRIEVRADLPGAEAIDAGDGAAGEDAAVWRARVGQPLVFAASSSSIRYGTVAAFASAVVALAAAAALTTWLARRRRRAPVLTLEPAVAQPAISLTDVTAVGETADRPA